MRALQDWLGWACCEIAFYLLSGEMILRCIRELAQDIEDEGNLYNRTLATPQDDDEFIDEFLQWRDNQWDGITPEPDVYTWTDHIVWAVGSRFYRLGCGFYEEA